MVTSDKAGLRGLIAGEETLVAWVTELAVLFALSPSVSSFVPSPLDLVQDDGNRQGTQDDLIGLSEYRPDQS